MLLPCLFFGASWLFVAASMCLVMRADCCAAVLIVVLQCWVKEITEKCLADHHIILVGTKCDLWESQKQPGDGLTTWEEGYSVIQPMSRWWIVLMMLVNPQLYHNDHLPTFLAIACGYCCLFLLPELLFVACLRLPSTHAQLTNCSPEDPHHAHGSASVVFESDQTVLCGLGGKGSWSCSVCVYICQDLPRRAEARGFRQRWRSRHLSGSSGYRAKGQDT